MTAPKRYHFRGQFLTVSEIAALSGRSKMTILRRRRGDRVIDEAEARSIDHQNKVAYAPKEGPKSYSAYETFEGKTLSIKGWAAELQVPWQTVRVWRWRYGMSMAEIVKKVRTDYEPQPDRRKRPLVPQSYNEVTGT